VEERTLAAGKQLKDMTLGEMDALWNEAKAQEKEK
jgi:XTP/dITP diphosphohydrolase